MKDSNDLLLKAADSTQEGVIVVDGAMRVLYLNAAAETILHCTVQNLAGKNLCEVMCTGRSPSSKAAMETSAEYPQHDPCDGKRCRRTVCFTRNDGMALPVRLSSAPLGESDNPTAIVVTVCAATEDDGQYSVDTLTPTGINDVLKDALAWHDARERQLEANVGSLRKISKEIENLKFALDQHSIVAVTDNEGRITYANDKFCEISQYSREELLGQDHRILNSGHHSADFFKDMWATIGRGDVWKGEILNRSKSGNLYWVDTTIVPFLDDKGIPYQYVAIRTDISERKYAEEEIRQARDAALDALRIKSEFLATMSHEIRTPMNGIIGVADLLLQMPLTEEVRQYINIISNSADTLLHILNDILDFSKLESGKIEIDAADFDPLAVVDFSLDLLAPRAYEKSLQLLSFVDPRLPPMLVGDAGRLRQILLNLISNAIKFTVQGEIVVRAVQESKTDTHIHVYFEITDTGIGISPPELKRLFQPFTQADGSTTRKYGGTGLGLIITKRLVELMGGEIGVSSEKGNGSSFWFRLPFKRSETARERLHRFKKIDLHRIKMLLADRNPTSHDIFNSYLAFWGVDCTCVSDGKEALALMKRAASTNTPFGMAFLDATLADINVFSLAHAIREDPALQSTRLVLLSPAANKQGEAARALKAGFEACYTKPLKQSELLDSIESLALRKEATSLPKKFLRSGHYRVQGYEIIDPAPAGLTNLGRPVSQDKIPSMPSPGPAPAGLHSKHPLLVVEDHPVNQLITRKQLEDIGLDVDVASNGQEAVARFEKQIYALILMDCHMPVMDGFEATARIRALEEQRKSPAQVPIIALTARVSDTNREECIKAGMDDYLHKPVNTDKLRATIRHWLENSPKGQTESGTGAIRSRGEVLDYKALDELRRLTGKEFNDIVCLFLNDTPELIAALRNGIRQGAAKTVCQIAHKLKSSSANLGANGLSHLARGLEIKARIGDMDSAMDSVAAFDSEYQQVRRELAAYSERC